VKKIIAAGLLTTATLSLAPAAQAQSWVEDESAQICNVLYPVRTGNCNSR
jgi:hypothetical protein